MLAFLKASLQKKGGNGQKTRRALVEYHLAGELMNAFTPGIVAHIKEIGYHPFIVVRVGAETDLAPRYVTCLTQNDAAAFVECLASEPSFAASQLVRGFERALQHEIYEAADLMFAWVKNAGSLDEVIYVGIDETVSLFYYAGYATFEIGGRSPPATPAGRAAMLSEALGSYHAATGNDALRMSMIEALGLALSRSLGWLGNYAAAAVSVDMALEARPYSIHLKAARHALAQRLSGTAVTPRLVKFVGEDNGFLKQFVCREPFSRFDIGPSGEVLVCCGHWLPTSIGDFQKSSVEEVLNSPTALKIRQSVTDGTYKYCNHLECGTMAQGALHTLDAPANERARQAVASGNFRVDGVDQVLFAFDQSCNLSCPSCRRERIIERPSQSEEKAQAVEQKLLPLLPKLRVLNLNPAGELFSSKPSRRLLELIDDESCPDLVLEIISNGTLFSETEWNKYPGIHSKVRSVRISVDAAHKDTFEKLRRLGNHENFVKNMEFLSQLRAKEVFPILCFSFTYQRDNFREMKEFVAFCQRMNCDFVIFERLQNLGAFSDAEYRERAVHYPTHPLYREFIDVIGDPVFRGSIVWHDFSYDEVENMSREEAVNRLAVASSRLATWPT